MYNNLKSGKPITQLDVEDINKIIQYPVGKAIYKTSIMNKEEENIQKPFGRPRKKEEDKAKPTDRIKCEVCGEIYSRCHKSSHQVSKIHLAYAKMNQKLLKLLLDNDK